MTDTLDYYNRNARAFAEGTAGVDFHRIQEEFCSRLNPGARLLDFGCGSGRDTKYFLGRGFCVEASDGSGQMCRLAQEYTGVPVREMLFEELDEEERYDGIWACASILHVKKDKLPEILRKMFRALKRDGIAYISFKYGQGEGMRDGRYFSNYTEETIPGLLGSVPGCRTEKQWITGDARKGREEERWLNLILRKTESGTERRDEE